MKKLFNLALAASILCSQTGCVGNQEPKENFPCAAAEIKQKLAKAIEPSLTAVPDNFFETFDYAKADKDWDKIMDVLDTQEEIWFWETLINMRLQMIRAAAMAEENISLPDLDISPETLSAVIAYEEARPYAPDLKEIDEVRQFVIGMALGNMPIPPSDEEIEAYIEQWGGKDTKKFFEKVRSEVLRYYKEALLVRQSGKTPEDYASAKKAEAGVAEYAVHIQTPKLYPAELAIAAFGLSKEDEDSVYVFPKIFLKNTSSDNSIRIENEKPLPYNLTLAWYSITENKNYKLQTPLPRQQLLEKFTGGNEENSWDAVLVTLEPYGHVTLYFYNQITGKKERLARFQAEEYSLSLNDFRRMGPLYESADAPAADWNEYRKRALEQFPQAAENLKTRGRPVDGPGVNFWEENPSNIFEGLPEQEAVNTPDKEGFTPLINAVRANKEATVLALIKEGADVNYQAPCGETALTAAVSGGVVPFVKALISAGADVNVRETSSGQTPLMFAAMNGNHEMVRLLLNAGADVNARIVLNGQELQENALSAALNNNHPETAEILRNAGAEELESAAEYRRKPNTRRQTLLRRWGSRPFIRRLS